MRRWVAAVAAILALAGPAWAQNETSRPPQGIYLAPGQPAPAEGIFYSGEAFLRLVEALRDRESWQKQIQGLRDQVAALEQALQGSQEESAQLRQALDAMKLAVAKAEWIDQNWQRIADQFELILSKQTAYIDRLEARVGSLERQRNLALLTSPVLAILSLIVFAFGGR